MKFKTIIEPFRTFDDAATSVGKSIGTVEGDDESANGPPDSDRLR